jgi:hypothetical protein
MTQQHLPQKDNPPEKKIYHITPPLHQTSDPNDSDDDTSAVEPQPNEISEAEWIEVDEREWSDERLMDDARPGRRTWVGEKASEVSDGGEKTEEKGKKSE